MNQDRDKNRERFPETAKIVDEFRAAFGDGVRLVWGEENGEVIRSKEEGLRLQRQRDDERMRKKEDDYRRSSRKGARLYPR